MADRGVDTLRFGPMKPIGLVDPRTDKRPWAVVQLRREDRAGQMWNMVGFQTRLKIGEQRRIFTSIPGLSDAEFLRWGSIHRNSYLSFPSCLTAYGAHASRPDLIFAGQLTGVEGYTESAASGILAAVNLGRIVRGEDPVVPPPTTHARWPVPLPRQRETGPFPADELELGSGGSSAGARAGQEGEAVSGSASAPRRTSWPGWPPAVSSPAGVGSRGVRSRKHVEKTPVVDRDVDAFLRHLADERQLSDNTVRAYRRDLTELRRFLGEFLGRDGWRWSDPGCGSPRPEKLPGVVQSLGPLQAFRGEAALRREGPSSAICTARASSR